VQQACPRCNGRGQVVTDPCGACRGQGRIRKQKTLSVKVPAGVDTGDRIRLSGEGEAGRNGGPAGDLYVEIRVADHPIFENEPMPGVFIRTGTGGAGMTMCNEQTVLELSHKIISNAAAHGANCIVVACPMCHVKLDMKQADIERQYRIRHGMTVYFLSDLVGMALGLHENELGVDRHFVTKP